MDQDSTQPSAFPRPRSNPKAPIHRPLQHRVGEGAVEALDETRTIIRLQGGKTEVRDFQKIDSVLAEMDAFADAVAGVTPYPISTEEMVNTIASFEAVIQSIATGSTVRLQ